MNSRQARQIGLSPTAGAVPRYRTRNGDDDHDHPWQEGKHLALPRPRAAYDRTPHGWSSGDDRTVTASFASGTYTENRVRQVD
jgi:hypothetical protein